MGQPPELLARGTEILTHPTLGVADGLLVDLEHRPSASCGGGA